jgi:cobalt-zinc-cadmium efflux system membrane fusion protein
LEYFSVNQQEITMRIRLTTAMAVLVLALGGCGKGTQSPATAEQPAPQTAAATPADWCAGCGVPESMCTVCNPQLVAKFKESGDWCESHGFPESVCPTCNPQAPPSAGAVVADWCIEHGLPESKCTKCNTKLVADYKASGDWCNEHGYPESVCPSCSPQQPPPGVEQAAIEARVVRFRSPEIEAAAGIETTVARNGQLADTVSCTARIGFDADRTADVRAFVPGVIRDVLVELGALVEKGAPLFELESSRISEIQGDLQTARERLRTAEANLARQHSLHESEIASARQVEMARQEVASAQGQARSAEAALRMAGAGEDSQSGRYTLVAPLAGTVVRRPAVVGVQATVDTSLATIADTSIMWALCDVPEEDASRVSVGQKMRVRIGDGEPVEGSITWVASEVDPRTRTLAARAELPNPQGRLKANQFATAQIQTDAARTAVSVPRSAVQRVGGREVVFVRTAQGVYEPRMVERHGDGALVQVAGRVAPGDAVVTIGAVLLRTEVMPGSIGAGCCEVEPRSIQARND